ncbi:MAG: hypothetical protein Q9Q40_02100 [Acidobacteriota bacterium]|nr:hypothetical protein [Acidobacteriota bacterium]MDQ7088572.1 hypothetical protein [Acidobacteriota bacterium]
MSRNAEITPDAPAAGNEQYRVPKVQVPLWLILDGGHAIEGHVHLLPVAGVHAGRERVIDLLCAEHSHFLPVSLSDRVRLVHRSRVLLAGVQDPYDAGLGDDNGVEGRDVEVELELKGIEAPAHRIAGTVHIVMPPGSQRLVDYLNQPAPFFPLRNREKGLVLVNKSFVVDALLA